MPKTVRWGLMSIGILLFSKASVWRAVAQEEAPVEQPPPSGVEDILSQILGFLYTIAHWLGQLVANLLQAIFPAFEVPPSIVDPIGLLGLVTILFAIAEFSKRAIWMLIGLGWLLIVIRIMIAAVQG